MTTNKVNKYFLKMTRYHSKAQPNNTLEQQWIKLRIIFQNEYDNNYIFLLLITTG